MIPRQAKCYEISYAELRENNLVLVSRRAGRSCIYKIQRENDPLMFSEIRLRSKPQGSRLYCFEWNEGSKKRRIFKLKL